MFLQEGVGKKGRVMSKWMKNIEKKEKDLFIFVRRTFCSGSDTQFFETVE